MGARPRRGGGRPLRSGTLILHAVTDDAVLARPGFEGAARAVLAAGGGALALHLRGPATGGRRLYEMAAALGSQASAHGALLVVNDRVDVALAAGADGVHLGARSLAVADARRLVGAGMRVGASVHGAEEAAALDGPADWLLVGTIWPSPSHPERAGAGLGPLQLLAGAGTPVIAIGGVTPARAAEARRAGAAGIAALRGIWDAPDPAAAVAEYLDGWRQG